MKFQFKLIIVVCFLAFSNVEARDVILVENLGERDQGELLMKILQEKFNIPRKLITYKSISNQCAKDSDAIMQLCLRKDGEMEILKLNKFVIENSLRVFLETEE